jgi:HNH endonuclease/AP2 domain
MITQARLKKLLRYNPKTGEFFWRVVRGKRTDLVGRCTGCPDRQGYLVIRIDDKLYRAHRLAWLYVYGKFPNRQLDHKNRNRADNRILNLRESTQGQNVGNAKIHRDNKSGLKGVTRIKNSWVAQIGKNYKNIHLGCFRTPEAAHAAYCAAAKKLHGKFFHAGG